jgi:hypothetical protein
MGPITIGIHGGCGTCAPESLEQGEWQSVREHLARSLQSGWAIPAGAARAILPRRRFAVISTWRTDMALQPGDKAPDFTLPAHSGDKVALSGFRGRPTVVAFMPFAFTGG